MFYEQFKKKLADDAGVTAPAAATGAAPGGAPAAGNGAVPSGSTSARSDTTSGA